MIILEFIKPCHYLQLTTKNSRRKLNWFFANTRWKVVRNYERPVLLQISRWHLSPVVIACSGKISTKWPLGFVWAKKPSVWGNFKDFLLINSRSFISTLTNNNKWSVFWGWNIVFLFWRFVPIISASVDILFFRMLRNSSRRRSSSSITNSGYLKDSCSHN